MFHISIVSSLREPTPATRPPLVELSLSIFLIMASRCSSAAPDFQGAIDTSGHDCLSSQVDRGHKVVMHVQHLPVASSAA